MSSPGIVDWSVTPPVFRLCIDCGAETTSPDRCYECLAERDSTHDSRVELRRQLADLPGTRPRLGSAELRERVKPPSAIDAAARKLADGTMDKAVFFGPTGSGKTALALALLGSWMAKNRRAAKFVRSHDLIGMEVPRELITAPLVLIDDLGSERSVANTLVSSLIDSRYVEGRPMWVTVAADVTDVSRRYGGQVVRRIMERSAIFHLGGP